MIQIDQLIVIVAPSCAGKSYLISKIKNGDCPHLCKQVGIDVPSLWHYAHFNNLMYIRQPIIERLVVHYDLSAKYIKYKNFNSLIELITESGSVITITLHVSHELLIKRNGLRLRESISHLMVKKGIARRIKALNSIKRLLILRKYYKRGFIDLIYKEWSKYILQSNTNNHWQLDFNKSDIMVAYPYMEDKDTNIHDINEVIGHR